MATRASYERPTICPVGSVAEVTLANANGGSLDHSFPAGTPAGKLTFS